MGQLIREARIFSLVVPNGTALSGIVDGRYWSAGVIEMPAALTSVAMRFDVSADGGTTWVPLYTAANVLVSITVAASRAYPLPAELAGAERWRVNLGTNEAAQRTLKLHVKS